MSKTTIADTRVKLRPSKKVLDVISENIKDADEIPENVAQILKNNGYRIPQKLKFVSNDKPISKPKIDVNLLNQLVDSKEEIKNETGDKASGKEENDEEVESESYLYLRDLKWLNNFLSKLRKEKGLDIYLHNVIETSSLVLPENEVIERNPELEARCVKLREQQENLAYYKMTKNVDASLKYYPEDTVAFQLKAINSQVIAVFQFVVSVIAGFAFGFLGVQWIVGNLDFGFRLLLGVMCALIIALAEMYFLAKKLVEYDAAVDTKIPKAHPNLKQKAHND